MSEKRIKLLTFDLEDRRSIQLSYPPISGSRGLEPHSLHVTQSFYQLNYTSIRTPGGSRSPNLLFWRQTLCQLSYRRIVELGRIKLPTSCVQDKCSIQLNYSPISERERDQTPNLLIRSQVCYSVTLRVHVRCLGIEPKTSALKGLSYFHLSFQRI